MNHATTYHFGNNSCFSGTKAKKIARTGKRVYAVDAKTQRCRRDQQGQKTARPDLHVTHAFLRSTFLPKLKESETLQVSQKTKRKERNFYQSLSHLTEHYGIQNMPTQCYAYPYNIALALWDTEKKLQNKLTDFEELKLIEDKGKTYLAIEERLGTGTTLYYIPVIPLYRMLLDSRRRHAAQLLLSVCSYLYHIADVPYYRKVNTFLYWQYEMLKEWVMDEYSDESDENLNEFEQAEWIGERMEKKIFSHNNLTFFRNRLTSFRCKDQLDLDCVAVAEKAFYLYEHYPHETVFRNAPLCNEDEEDGSDNIVTMDRYISFSADGKGWLADQLEESVNNYLHEYGEIEEPTIIKIFDGREVSGNGLDFEKRLFTMMEELANILYHY